MISDQEFLDWQLADAVRRVLLVEASPYVGAAGAGALTTRYLSNRGFLTGSADTPADICYEDRISATPAFSLRMGEFLLGRSTPSWGDIEISNGDRKLDSWLDDGWEGCDVNLYLGDASWNRSDFRQIGALTAASLTATEGATLLIKIRDMQKRLDVPLTTEVMGTGPNANALKPIAYGFCRNITPVCEDTATLKYRCNAFEVNVIDDVRDNGVSVAFTADRADGSFTLSSAPAGTVTCDISSGGRSIYENWLLEGRDATSTGGHHLEARGKTGSGTYAGGVTFVASTHSIVAASGTPFASIPGLTPNWTLYITGALNKQNNGAHLVKSMSGGGTTLVLESKLIDEVAAGAVVYTQGTTTISIAGGRSLWCAYLMRRILERHTALPSGQLAIGIHDLNAEVALYATASMTVADALDKLATAAVGFYAFDEAGAIYAGVVKDPSGLTSVLDLTQDQVEIKSLRVVRDIPAFSGVKLKLERNWTQQTSFAGAVTDASRAKWTGDHYSIATQNAANSSKYPIAVQWESADDDVLAYDQYPSDSSDPWHASYDSDVKDTLCDLFGVHRRVYSFDTRWALYTLRLGDAINLTHPAFGFAGGANALVVGLVRNFSTGVTTLEILR